MAWRNFKYGDEVQIKNLLQGDILSFILENDLLVHPNLHMDYRWTERKFGTKCWIAYPIEARSPVASGWYSLETPQGVDMIAHETELILIRDVKDEIKAAMEKRTARLNWEQKGAMERWLTS